MRTSRTAAEVAATEAFNTEAFNTEAFRIREQRARRLFDQWTGVTNPEIRSALWHNLSAGDRSHWRDRADEETGKESLRTPKAPPYDAGERAALS